MATNGRPSFFIKTFGCQMNKFDSAEFERFFLSLGMTEAARAEDASLVHVNTCCVRQKAEDKFFSMLGELRELKENSPGMIIGVSGCIPEVRDILKGHKYVDYAAGSRAPSRYFDEIKQLISNRPAPGARIAKRENLQASAAEDIAEEDAADIGEEFPVRSPVSDVSAYLTVIRGCSNMCAYCVVPRARGPEVSRPVAKIVEDAKRLIGAGAKEIILLGQNALAYGLDLSPKLSLLDAIEAVHGLPGLKRLRFVTSHPRWVNEEFLTGLKAFPLVCEHFHVPPQSGDDDILRVMGRGYTADDYAQKVAMIREHFPAAGITADLIVGFPGETDEQFENTLSMMRRVVVSAAFTFMYSPRPNTAALRMGDDVPAQKKAERLQRLNALHREISLRLNKALIESSLEVMVDAEVSEGRYKGRTRCNRIADFASDARLAPGDLLRVVVTSATPYALIGKAKT